MITFAITAKMYALLGLYKCDDPTTVNLGKCLPNGEVLVSVEEEGARKLIKYFAGVVNSCSAFRNTNDDHTAALAAIKRIRKAMKLAGTLEGTALVGVK